MKKVSVVIPTYKNRGGLTRSVDSALSQTYKNIEILVVDDNSPNSEGRKLTEKVMYQYEGEPRIKYLKHEANKNGAAARNTGIKAASGELIAFLDDDDYWDELKIERQVIYLEKHPEFDGTYCFVKDKPISFSKEGNLVKDVFLMKSTMYTPTLMIKKSALKSIRGFDEDFRRHQDYEMLIRFFEAGFKMGCVKEFLVSLGKNQGENIPSTDKSIQIKKIFFTKLGTILDKYEDKEPGFKKRVFARHYVGVVLSFLKEKRLNSAIRYAVKYFCMSPIEFTSLMWNHLKAHL